jgi:uncharacterized protein YcfJ
MRPGKITKIALFAVLATAALSAAAEDYEDYARVKSATPEYERVNTPRRECRTEYIEGAARPAERGYSGPIIGGIAGAILGNQIGGGRGKEAATAAGAITGAIVGDRVQNSGQYDDGGGREVRRCREVDHWERRLTGYRVEYEYGGRRFTAFLPHDPGRELRVRVSVEPY